MVLFYFSWKIFESARKNCMTYFATMNEKDDLVDAGNCKLLGRWHYMGGAGGWGICDAPTYADVAAWIYNWAPMCDCKIEAVLTDDEQRAILLKKYKMGNLSWNAKVDRDASAQPKDGETIYHISYKFKQGHATTGFKAFAGMTAAADQGDKGNCASMGRWHNLGTGSGYAVCAAKTPADVHGWAANWADICVCDIVPVLTDKQSREIVRAKPDFEMACGNVLKTVGMLAGGVKSFAECKKKLGM